MQNPYTPTRHAAMPMPARVQWLRVTVGAVLCLILFYVVVVAIQLAFALGGAQLDPSRRWMLSVLNYGSYWLLGGLIYWRVAVGVHRHLLAHLLAMYLLIELIDYGLLALLGMKSFPPDLRSIFFRVLSLPPALFAWAWVARQRRDA
jgi:predicted transporter